MNILTKIQELPAAMRRLPKTIRSRFTTPDQYLLFFSLVFILFGVIILPLGYIFVFSFAPEFPLTEPFVPTLKHYTQMIEDTDLLLDITINTALFATGTVLFSLIIGITAAIFEEKYFGGQSYFRILMLLPYGLPTVATVTGWIWLAGSAGVFTEWVVALLNLEGAPWNIYSLAGMIFVDGLHAAPLAFLLISPSIRSISAATEEAALTAGASRLTVYRKIVLPLIAPAILSISVFLFARSMAVVTVPAILGLPKGIYTFGSAIPFLFLSGFELDYSTSIAFGVYITVISAILIWIYYRAVDKADRYATVTGQGGGEPKIYEVGIVKKSLIGLFFVGYLLVGGLIPLWAIIWDSLLPTFEFTWNIAALSFENYVALFNNDLEGVSDFWGTLTNTLVIGLVVPTIAMLISFLMSFTNRTSTIPFSGVIEFIASVPLAVPTIVISLAFLSLFIGTPLYGTVTLMVIAFMARAIPIGLRYTSPAMTRIGIENIEAAAVSGYGELRTFKKIVLPLATDDYVAGWMHLFVFAVRNVSIPILLVTSSTQVLAVDLLFTLNAMYFKAAATMAVVVTVISIIPYMILQYWRTKGSFDQGQTATE